MFPRQGLSRLADVALLLSSPGHSWEGRGFCQVRLGLAHNFQTWVAGEMLSICPSTWALTHPPSSNPISALAPAPNLTCAPAAVSNPN